MAKRSAVALLALALVSTAFVANAGPRRHHRHHPRPQPRSECPLDCGAKLDHGPWVFNGTEPVTDLCIQAGQDLVSVSSDGQTGCYTVTGLGTTQVRVREGRGRECRDIRSIVFYHDCDDTGDGGGGGTGGGGGGGVGVG